MVDVHNNGVVVGIVDVMTVGSVSHTVMPHQFEHKKLLTTKQLPCRKVQCSLNLDLRFGPVHLVPNLEPIKTGPVRPFTGPDTGPLGLVWSGPQSDWSWTKLWTVYGC